MKIKIRSLFILIVSCFFNSCKNKDCKEKGNCPEEYYRFRLGEAKSYLWAKTGSYWIYKEISSGALDTQIVLGFSFDSITKQGKQNYSKHITIEFDRISRNISSSYFKWTYNDVSINWSPDGNNFKNWRVILERQALGGSSAPAGVSTVFFNPFAIDTYHSETRCSDNVLTMVIQGKTYFNVTKFEVSLDGVWENSPPYTGSAYYWAKDIGLIKRAATHKSDNWELIECNILH